MGARVWVLAFIPPFLAGARGVCAWVRVLPLFRLSYLGFVVCAFGYRVCPNPANAGWGWWRVCLGMGFA